MALGANQGMALHTWIERCEVLFLLAMLTDKLGVDFAVVVVIFGEAGDLARCSP